MNHVRLGISGRKKWRGGRDCGTGQVMLEGIDLRGIPLRCDSEDGELKSVLVHPPDYLDWTRESAINSVQRHNAPPPRRQVKSEHRMLVDAISSEGAAVYSVRPHSWLPEGVYQRDSVAVIGNKAYSARFRYSIRQRECALIESAAFPWRRDDIIEFGDVLVFPDAVLVGLGQRSNRHAARTLQGELCGKEVIPVPLSGDALHLDYATTIGGRGRMRTMVCCPGLFADGGMVEWIKWRFDVRNTVEVPYGRHTEGWTNLFFLNPETVVSADSAHEVNRALGEIGFRVIAVPFEGILRGEGAPRCCTAPLERAD